MKKIGNKVLLMIAVFVVIFGINTAVSVRTQKSVKLAGARITEQYIPIQTEIFNIQKSMERGQKYLNIISLYDDDDLRQQLETSLADEITTIAESEKSISAYLEKMDQTDLADKIKNYEEFLRILVDDVFLECGRILRPKKYMCLIVSDFRNKSEFISFHSDLIQALNKRTTSDGYKITLQGVKVLLQNHKTLLPYGYPFAYVENIHHQYILIFRKDKK